MTNDNSRRATLSGVKITKNPRCYASNRFWRGLVADSFGPLLDMLQHTQMNAMNQGVSPDRPVEGWTHIDLIPSAAFESSLPVGEFDKPKLATGAAE